MSTTTLHTRTPNNTTIALASVSLLVLSSVYIFNHAPIAVAHLHPAVNMQLTTCTLPKYRNTIKEIVGFFEANHFNVNYVARDADIVMNCIPFMCTGGGGAKTRPLSCDPDFEAAGCSKGHRSMGVYGAPAAVQSKRALCELIRFSRERYGDKIGWLAMPCITNNVQLAALQVQYPWWLYKKDKASSGKGIRLVPASQLQKVMDDAESSDLAQAYISRPFTIQHTFDAAAVAAAKKVRAPGVKLGRTIHVKADLRIYGVITAMRPAPRVYVSNRGYYRTGDPFVNFTMPPTHGVFDKLVHITNNGPKLASGRFILGRTKTNTGGEDFDAFSSGGSLEKFYALAEQSGLSGKKIKSSINELFFRIALLMAEGGLDDGAQPGGDCAPSSGFIPFFADVGVDASGTAYLYETHVGCPLKPHNSGDVESGRDLFMTRETRAASFGTIVLGFAAQLKRDVFDAEMERVRSVWPSCDGCDKAREAAAIGAVEERVACELGFSTAHRRWRQSSFMLGADAKRWYNTYYERATANLLAHCTTAPLETNWDNFPVAQCAGLGKFFSEQIPLLVNGR